MPNTKVVQPTLSAQSLGRRSGWCFSSLLLLYLLLLLQMDLMRCDALDFVLYTNPSRTNIRKFIWVQLEMLFNAKRSRNECTGVSSVYSAWNDLIEIGFLGRDRVDCNKFSRYVLYQANHLRETSVKYLFYDTQSPHATWTKNHSNISLLFSQLSFAEFAVVSPFSVGGCSHPS